MKLLTRTTVLLLAVALFSVAGFAATSAAGVNTVAPTMTVNVNVQTAVSLTVSTGAAVNSCLVTAPGPGTDYSIDFGNVNGLGIGNPTCGAVTPGAGNATYSTNYTLLPVYSGFTATAATISVTAPAFTHNTILSLVEGGTAGTMGAVPTSGTAHNVSGLASGTAVSRYLGVVVTAGNGLGAFPGTAGAPGADSTIVTFTMTVP